MPEHFPPPQVLERAPAEEPPLREAELALARASAVESPPPLPALVPGQVRPARPAALESCWELPCARPERVQVICSRSLVLARRSVRRWEKQRESRPPLAPPEMVRDSDAK